MRPPFLLPLFIVASPAFAAEVSASSATSVASDEAEPTDSHPDEDDQSHDIVVVATRIAGQVDTDIPPIMTLDEADIESYGASSLSELLEALGPQTGSGRGRGDGHPVILLNGQRIASFRQMRDIPPDAIRRMEVLPEEVALKFGFAPDQRVVNFILKENFSTIQAAGEYNIPTRGGFAESEIEGKLIRFDGPSRINLNAKIEDSSMLTEAERDIEQAPGSVPGVPTDPDPANYRSLISDSVTRTLTGSWSTGLGDGGLGGTFTIDGEISRTDSRSLLGLNTVRLTALDGESTLRSLPGALERDAQTDSYEAGLTLNKPLGNWQLTATADSSYSNRSTRTDREADLSYLQDAVDAGDLAIDGALPAPAYPGRDRTRTKLLTLSTYAGISGSPLSLPAGDASLTVETGYDHLDNRSSDSRQLQGDTTLKRDIVSGGANLSLPITSRRNGFMDGAGDISLNFSGNVHDLSDFGTLFDWSAGVIWSPTEKLTLNASYIVSEVAPGVGQLGNPIVETVNVPVYDFATGDTALITQITGGNPSLLAEKQRDIKLSADYQLPFLDRSSLIVEYFRNRSDDVTRDFPLLTPSVEAAFPDRVIRDANGNLVSIDSRPVTFSNVESDHLRWGLNLSGKIKNKEAPAGDGGARGGSRGGAGGGMPFGRGGHGGRWNIAVYHTWRFSDEVTIAPGSEPLDQLAGDSLVAGGVPRHEIELEGGVFHNGMGLRVNGTWTAPATVRASGAPGSSDLRFGSVTSLDMRFFINLGSKPKLVEEMPVLKGVRLSFDFDNILDSRQKVTDGNGDVPLAYQPGYRDPRGRFMGIDIKKSF